MLCPAGGLTPGIGDFSSEFLDLTAVSEKVTGREQIAKFSARLCCIGGEATASGADLGAGPADEGEIVVER